jgi:hypothetical protein
MSAQVLDVTTPEDNEAEGEWFLYAPLNRERSVDVIAEHDELYGGRDGWVYEGYNEATLIWEHDVARFEESNPIRFRSRKYLYNLLLARGRLVEYWYDMVYKREASAQRL